ncbi:hypothetical protein GCM10027346_39670 [Hymenobacter seoulensis]
MSGAGLCVVVSARRPVAPPSLIFLVLPRPTMKSCCEEAGAPARKGPVRRLLSYLLYAVVAAVLGFVLWQQWQA